MSVWTAAATVAAGATAVAVAMRLQSLDRRLRQEAAARRAAEAKLEGLQGQPAVGVFISREGRFVYANARLAEIFGYPVEELTGGLGAVDLASEADRAKVGESIQRVVAGDETACHLVFAAVRKDGTLAEVELNGRIVELEGRPAVVGVAFDVTELHRDRRQLKYLAFFDALTELPNRALFYDRLGQALAVQKRSQEPFALLALDLDGFKAVNDAHGHETGDALLQAVGRRFRQCVRETDTVARMGGDEFAVLLPGLGDPDVASAVAGKVLASLAEPFHLGGSQCRVGASIGLCLSPADGDDMETLLARADAAMYESKALGKNTFTRHRATLAAAEPVKMLHLDLGPERNVGVPVIDQQHARMADLLNVVADSVKSGREPEHVALLIDELVAFTRHHFETEQRLMRRHGYPEALAHAQEHRRLLADLVAIRSNAGAAGMMLTIHSLREWLTSHISHGDRELGKALVAVGAAKARGGPGRAPD